MESYSWCDQISREHTSTFTTFGKLSKQHESENKRDRAVPKLQFRPVNSDSTPTFFQELHKLTSSVKKTTEESSTHETNVHSPSILTPTKRELRAIEALTSNSKRKFHRHEDQHPPQTDGCTTSTDIQDLTLELDKLSTELTPSLFLSTTYITLVEACGNGFLELVKLFCTKFGHLFNIDALYKYNGSCSFVYISNKIRVTPVDIPLVKARFDTLLHIASEHGKLPVVKYLLEQGASIDVVNCCGRTALMVGIIYNNIIKCLIDAGANVNLQDKSGSTPLILAVLSFASVPVLELLLQAGADARIADYHGYTAVHYAMNSIMSQTYLKVFFKHSTYPSCDSFGFLNFAERPLLLGDIPISVLKQIGTSIEMSKNIKFAIETLVQLGNKNYDKYNRVLNILQLKEEDSLSLTYNTYPVNEAYDGFKEVQSLLDWKDYVHAQDNVLAMQILLMMERVGGYGSFVALSNLLEYCKHYIKKDESFLIFHRFSEMLLYRVRLTPADKTVTHILKEVITFCIAFQQEQHDTPHILLQKILLNLATSFSLHVKNCYSTHSHSPSHVSKVIVNRSREDMNDLIKTTANFIHIILQSQENHPCDYTEIICKFLDVPFHFLTNNGQISSLSFATFTCGGSLEMLRKILSCGADRMINEPGEDGQYLLHTVTTNSRYIYLLETITLLLQHGAHPDVVNKKGKTPLQTTQNLKAFQSVYPLSLTCLTAQVIVTHGFKYTDMLLPRHIKAFIALHDPNRYDMLVEQCQYNTV